MRERLSAREEEVTGKWQTEEKLKSCGDYTPYFDCSAMNPNLYIQTIQLYSKVP